MRDKAEDVVIELKHYPHGKLRPAKGMKSDSKEVEGGRCMRGSDGKLFL